jgi:hypothetical protein
LKGGGTLNPPRVGYLLAIVLSVMFGRVAVIRVYKT